MAVETRVDPVTPEQWRSGATRRPAGVVRSRWLWAALVCGILAFVAALVLPIAPVSVNDPQVSWPQDPSSPRSTSLELTRYIPRNIDATVTCRALQAAAQATQATTVLATIRPIDPAAASHGLLVAVADGRVTVRVSGTDLLTAPVAGGGCTLHLVGDEGGVRLYQDGRQVGPTAAAPQVDALLTDLGPSADLQPGDLSVRVRVDDQFSSSPTPVKRALMVVLALGVLGALFCLWRAERGLPRTERHGRRRLSATALIDVAVVGTMVWWVFVGPTTVDDGYYAAMAKNVQSTGYVAQYYQLYNQSFAPFSWWYYLLSAWQHVAGTGLVVQRVPALVAGLVMWATIRWYSARRPRGAGWAPAGRLTSTMVFALVFVAWWTAFDLGVRPEPFAAAPLGVSLVAATIAVERQRLLPLGLAVVSAAVGFTAHPTGFVALAPLLVLAPRWWHLLRQPSWTSTIARVFAVAAPGALVSLLAFADNGLYDFSRSQAIFNGIEPQKGWSDEYLRYSSLLSYNDQGDFPKRVVVLLALLALAVLVLLLASSWRQHLDPRVRTATFVLIAALALLWLTPSKWTQHFGSLAVIGPLVIGFALTSVQQRLREHVQRAPRSGMAVLAVPVVVVLLAALALHGPNVWAPAWAIAQPHGILPPYLPGGLPLSDVALWVGIAVVAFLCVVLVGFRGRNGGRLAALRSRGPRQAAVLGAAVVTVLVLLVTSTGYLVGGFSLAALRTLHTWSPGAAALVDPLAQGCSAAGDIDVTDPRQAKALPVQNARTPAATAGTSGFATGGGWWEGDPPPFEGSDRPPVWGSLVAQSGSPLGTALESSVGTVTTPWFTLPTAPVPSSSLVVMAAGKLGGGNSLTVEYGTQDGRVVRSTPLDDGANSPAWRSLLLDQQTAGGTTTQVRLVARDGESGPGGWLAFAAPSVQQVEPLTALTGRSAPTAVGWLFAAYFPCQRQVRQQYGINEPPVYGVLQGDRNLDAFQDPTFNSSRGALFGRLLRGSAVTQVLTSFRDAPEIHTVQVYLFQRSLPPAAYDLVVRHETVSGLSGPDLGSPST